MNKTSRSMIVAAAMTGLLAGTITSVTTGCKSAGTESSTSMGAHSCAGQNGCKGMGGCKTSDNGCKGKNSCKGKGGCKVS